MRILCLIGAAAVLGLAGAAQAVVFPWGDVDWDTNSTTDGECLWDDAAPVPLGETPKAFSGWYLLGPGGLNSAATAFRIRGSYSVWVTDAGNNMARNLELTTATTFDKPYIGYGGRDLDVQAGASLVVAAQLTVNADFSKDANYEVHNYGTLTAGTVQLKNDTKVNPDTGVTGTGSATLTMYSGSRLNTGKINLNTTGTSFANLIFNSPGAEWSPAAVSTTDGTVDPTGVLEMTVAATLTSTTGSLVIDIGGTGRTDYDTLWFKALTGTLDGQVIDVALAPGYTPANGDKFQVVAAGALVLNSVSIVGDGNWTYALVDVLGSTTGIPGATDANTMKALELTFVPEPASLGLLGVGGLAVGARRRRPGGV